MEAIKRAVKVSEKKKRRNFKVRKDIGGYQGSLIQSYRGHFMALMISMKEPIKIFHLRTNEIFPKSLLEIKIK